MKAMKWIGIADGVAMAALEALGRLYTPAAPYTGPAVMILGVVGTYLGAQAARS